MWPKAEFGEQIGKPEALKAGCGGDFLWEYFELPETVQVWGMILRVRK